MLGYEASSLLFGMSSWTGDPDIYVKRFDPEKHTADYTIDTEIHQPGGPYELPFALPGAEGPAPEPTSVAAAEVPGVIPEAYNCVICHTDRDSLERLAVEEEEVESEQSSGEG